jgi:peptidyl-prolyl cis-trans isomerase D
MLLSLMRKNAKSWLIKFIMVIIAIVFVFYFGYSFTGQETTKVATVNGESITSQEYQKAYSEYYSSLQEQYKDMWNESLLKALDLENRTLEQLVQQKILEQESKRLGLGVTEKEVQDTITGYDAFKSGGVFDNAKYNAVLSNNRTNAETFEKSIEQNLLKQKVAQFLTSFLVISDQEVKDLYTYANEKVKVSYVTFSPSDYRSSVVVDKASMEKYFEAQKENYRMPPKIKITYVSAGPEEFINQVAVDEDEIRTYYEDNPDNFKVEKQVKARHILLRLSDNATAEMDKSVKAKAEKVLEKARAGEDFAKLAKEYSEDVSTKDNGGDLGYFQKGQMVSAFEDPAFSLPKGGVSSLVKTSFGYHIIKVDDIKEAKTLSLQEAHGQIADMLAANKAKELADEKILNLVDKMTGDVDLTQYAGKQGFSAVTTDYFPAEQPLQFLEGQTKVLNTIFSLQAREISDVVEINNRFYLIQVIDKKASYLPNLIEVSAAVEGMYKEYLAQQKAKSAAEAYLTRLKGGSDWSALAQERKLTPVTTDFFTRQALPQGMEAIQGLDSAVFKLSQNKRYPDNAFEGDAGAYILRWEDKKGIDEAKFKGEKDKYISNIKSMKEQYAYSAWMQRLMNNSKIDRSSFAQNK